MILAIGGLDSSGGAGLDQDRRTAEQLGCPLRSAVTAVTVQGEKGVEAVEPVSPGLLRHQIETHMAEDRPLAVKIGALFSSGQIHLIKDILSDWKKIRPDLVILADPVFAPTRGHPFLENRGVADYKIFLSVVDVLTPNREELEILTSRPVSTPQEGERAAMALAREYDLTVILTGGHFPGSRLEEKVVTKEKCRTYQKKRLALIRTHGTGCCLATALTVYLTQGYSVQKGFVRATKAVSRLMSN